MLIFSLDVNSGVRYFSKQQPDWFKFFRSALIFLRCPTAPAVCQSGVVQVDAWSDLAKNVTMVHGDWPSR